jgi:hypothetical protein
MKKFPLILVILSFIYIFSSCQKELTGDVTITPTPSSGFYIKGKKDGVAFNFIKDPQAIVTVVPPVTILNMLAYGAVGIEGLTLAINFTNGTVQPGTYSETNAGVDYILLGLYNPNSTNFVYGAGIQPSVKPLVLTILTKTATEITGTFSGAFYKQDVQGTFFPDFITITEGEFKLPIK